MKKGLYLANIVRLEMVGFNLLGLTLYYPYRIFKGFPLLSISIIYHFGEQAILPCFYLWDQLFGNLVRCFNHLLL